MSIEDDITKVLAEWHAEPADPEAWQVAMFEDAVVRIMPLVKRARAEAWFAGYDKGNLDGYFGTDKERAASPYAEFDPYNENEGERA